MTDVTDVMRQNVNQGDDTEGACSAGHFTCDTGGKFKNAEEKEYKNDHAMAELRAAIDEYFFKNPDLKIPEHKRDEFEKYVHALMVLNGEDVTRAIIIAMDDVEM